MFLNRRQKGFTLVELLVVISIIGLLSSVVLAALSSAKQKSGEAKASLDRRTVEQALELYYQDHGDYPPVGGKLYVDTAANGNWSTTLGNYLKPYLPVMPVPSFPSKSQGGLLYAGYSYAKGTAASPQTFGGPIVNGNTMQPVACMYVYDGYYMSFIVAPPQTLLTLNDGGPDPDGVELMKGDVRVIPTSAFTCPATP